MSMIVMKALSAFELKAWLGVNLFVSYFTEVIGGEPLRIARLGCIALTVIGLVLIVRSDKEEKTDYLKILLPLALYLFSKYGYSIVIKGFSPYISSTLQLLPALVMISLVLLFMVKPAEIFRKSKKGALTVILTRIPNAAGTLLENAVIAISITSYSFIQPMILVSLFLIVFFRSKRRFSKEFVGSLVCIAGIALFVFV
jgi:drug/metabolite transporter (DMT)-like permease